MQLGLQGVDVMAAVNTPKPVKSPVVLEDINFWVEFDGQLWEVEWKWKDNPSVLTNQVTQYAINDNDRDAYNTESGLMG